MRVPSMSEQNSRRDDILSIYCLVNMRGKTVGIVPRWFHILFRSL